MAGVCNQDNAHADWLIVRQYSSIMPSGLFWANENKAKRIPKNPYLVFFFLKIVVAKNNEP